MVQLYWPQNGAQINGTNFTWRGHVDDFTATLAAQMVDTNGNTNIFNGVVERDGDFWIENLSLDSGTNNLTLIATDAAGNVSMTNITLFQSAIGLTINPPDSSQFWNPTMTIYGTISDSSDYTVWVNGVKATMNGDGTWEADNVPNTPGGTAVFQARAIPNTDNGGNGAGGGGGDSASYDNPGNPDSAQAQDADSQTDKPMRLFVSSSKVSYTWHWRLYHAYYDGNMQLIGTNLNDYHEEYQPQWDWKDGSGGSGDWTSEWSGDGNSSSEETTVNWPKTFWPDLEWGTEEISGNGGDPEEGWVDEPAIVEEHCEVKNPSPQDDDVWILNGNEWDETKDHWDYARHAQTHMKLFTGGKGKPQRQNLFVVNGSANEVLNQWARPYRDDLTEFIYWDPEAGGPDIPKQDITIGELGQLGSDGNLYVLLPDNVTKDVTPKIKNKDFYIYDVEAAKYTLIHLTECTAMGNTNDERTTIGVGENVDLMGMPDNTVWSTTAGSLYSMNGSWTIFTAPSTAEPVTVTASVGGQSLPVTFAVLEPTGIDHAQIIGTEHFPVGEAGAGMTNAIWIAPTSVSFCQVQLMEVGEDASSVSGYFANTNLFTANPAHYWRHDVAAGADTWRPLSNNNELEDLASITSLPPPWSSGSISWEIPVKWKVGDNGATNSMLDYNQVFSIDGSGTVTSQKFGNAVTRTTNDVITTN